MRIFKLARRSVGLQSIAHTVRTSWKDLGLLFSLVAMGMLVFGSLEYFIENDQEATGFTSIPQVMHMMPWHFLLKILEEFSESTNAKRKSKILGRKYKLFIKTQTALPNSPDLTS